MALSKIVPLVLAVAPDEEDLRAMTHILRDLSYGRCLTSRGCRDACQILEREPVSMILVDHFNGEWVDILPSAWRKKPQPRVIVGLRFSQLFGDLDALLEMGAYEILATPYRSDEVGQALGFAWQSWLREWSESCSEAARRRERWRQRAASSREPGSRAGYGHGRESSLFEPAALA